MFGWPRVAISPRGQAQGRVWRWQCGKMEKESGNGARNCKDRLLGSAAARHPCDCGRRDAGGAKRGCSEEADVLWRRVAADATALPSVPPRRGNCGDGV